MCVVYLRLQGTKDRLGGGHIHWTFNVNWHWDNYYNLLLTLTIIIKCYEGEKTFIMFWIDLYKVCIFESSQNKKCTIFIYVLYICSLP